MRRLSKVVVLINQKREGEKRSISSLSLRLNAGIMGHPVCASAQIYEP